MPEHARRRGAGEIPLGQPARRAAIETLADQVGVGLHQIALYVRLHLGLVLAADGFAGHHLAQADLGDGLVHVDREPLVIQTAGLIGLHQLRAHPVGQDDAGIGLHRFQRGEQAGTIVRRGSGGEPADDGGRSELLGRDQPEFHVAALESHRPVQPVREPHAVWLVVVIGAGGERPEFPFGQRFAAHRIFLSQQAQLAGRQEGEPPPVAYPDRVQGHGGPIARPQAFADREAVEHAEMHPHAGIVEPDGFQHFLQQRGGVFVRAARAAGLDFPLGGHQGELALLEGAAYLPVAQHFAIEVVG